MDTPADISEYLSGTIQFLWEHSWIFRESNTKFVESGVLDNIPRSWVEVIQKMTNEEFNRFPFGLATGDMPESLASLLQLVQEMSFQGRTYFCQLKEEITTLDRIKGMSPKKSHEIIRLAEVIRSRCGPEDILVDLGCGLGYLSQYLHEKHKYKILGLDSDPRRVESALGRQKKFFPRSNDSVKYISHLITESSMSFIKEQVREQFHLTHVRVILIGLHACGDLTVTALKLSTMNPENVNGLIIMPCCYHRMELIDDKEFRNFPLSGALQSIVKELNGSKHDHYSSPFHRPFLRLACQQSAKHWSKQEHVIHGERMFKRSLVGALVANEGNGEYSIRKMVKSCASLSDSTFDGIMGEYCVFHNDREIPWTQDHSKRYEYYSTKYENGGQLAEILTGLQTAIQEICETVVLLDKVQYVNELSVRNRSCFIRKITDEELSPRCFALIIERGNN